MKRALAVVVSSLVVACSSSHNAADALHIVGVGIDAAPDSSIGPNFVELDVEADGTLALVAYRDGSGPWQTPSAAAQGEYNLYVTTDYEIVIVCTGSGGAFDAEQLSTTFAESSMPFMFCGAGSGSTASTVAVTGTMTQPGSVWMSDDDTSTGSNWSYELDVAPGTHDLVAIGDNHLAIQRALAITAAVVEPTIDVDATGTALTSVPLTITGGAAGATVSTQAFWYTGHDSATISTTTTTAQVPPASLVMVHDFQSLEVQEITATTNQYGSTKFTGTETTFALLPVLTTVTLDTSSGLAGTWGTLPTYTDLGFGLFEATGTSYQNVSASAGWLTAHHATSLGPDTSAPGYLDAWKITTDYIWDFSLDDDSGETSYGTSVFGNSTTLRARQHAAHARRVADCARRVGNRAARTACR